MHPILKVVSDQGCQCYLVGCPVTHEALLVDPKVGSRQSLLELAEHFGLRITQVLDTHSHADHLSDSLAWCTAGATLYMSEQTACRRPMKRLAHGAPLKVGDLQFETRSVPGHTPDSMALVGHGVAIVGDSLFIGGLARADFRGSDPDQLFESVLGQLMSLDDNTLVFPGHSYNDILFSTVAQERVSNTALQHASGADFAQQLGAVAGNGNSPDVDLTLQMNQDENPDLPDEPRNVVACCSAGASVETRRAREAWPEDLEAERSQHTDKQAWIDVRDPHEYRASHVPGARLMPLSELGFHLPELQGIEPLVINCKAGVRSMTAARTLMHLGVVEDPVSMAGGFDRWLAEGRPTTD